MSRVAYVNGRYVPHAQAGIHIEDRGYQFSDGVYEVCYVEDGRLFDEDAHLDRLDRSLRELGIDRPMDRRALKMVMRSVVARNRVRRGLLYMQVTRGVARRDFPFPADTPPAIVMTCRSVKPHSAEMLERGIKVVTMPDRRWARRDIKSVSLLANVLAKQAAREQGAYEGWMLDDEGKVTEGTSSTAWIVKGRELITRALSTSILPGVTRKTLTELAEAAQFKLVERAFTVEEAQAADEAFMTSASSFVLPIVAIDGKPVGGGKPGPTARRLRDIYLDGQRKG